MFQFQRQNSQLRGRWGAHLCLLVTALWIAVAATRGAAQGPQPIAANSSPETLTSFEQIWQSDQHQRHPVRFEYVVYYYDPLWKALWGRCGEADSYLSFGAKTFAIKPGQKILVEGVVEPARGMKIDDPKVTVLEDSAPIEVVSTEGQVGSTERFNKRLVKLSGLVDHQVVRDANHLELYVIADGRMVLLQLLLKSDAPLPQLSGSLISAKGVYYARNEREWAGPRIELWVQQIDDIDVVGTLETDERFVGPTTPLADLSKADPRSWIHIRGTVQSQEIGKEITIGDGGGSVVLSSVQSFSYRIGETVEAIGKLVDDGNRVRLNEALVRQPDALVTNISQFWNLSDSEKRNWRRIRLEVVIYYFDPLWKVLWGRTGGVDGYLSLGDRNFPIQPGQKVLIEGSVLPANGLTVVNPKVTVLEEAKPLMAVPLAERIGETDKLAPLFVQTEGYVDRQLLTDARHLEVDMVVDGKWMIGRVLLPEGVAAPNWDGALLRVKGVYSPAEDPTGGPPIITMWIPSPDFGEVLGRIDDDPRFKMAATPIDQLAAVAPGTLVKIVAAVRSQQQGKTLTLRDETGQATVATALTKPVPSGQMLEVIGYVSGEPAGPQLQNGLFRRSQAALPVAKSGLPTLRLTDQLRELQPEEAARSYPVRLTGVVTWTRPNADFFYILDATGGVRVYRPPQIVGGLTMGSKVELTGVSAAGRFTPVVMADRVEALSTMELPEARQVTLEQALTGIEEAQWVSMTGYVRAVVPDGPWSRIELTTSAGEFQAMVAPNPRWEKIVGSIIRIKGVCSALANSKRQLTGIQVWVPATRLIDVEQPAPEDPFSVPTRAIASLRQFSSIDVMNRLVRVSGIVIHHSPGRLVHLQDGTESLLVLSRGTKPLTPGDRIEAVGYPGRENNRVVLREAVYRQIAAAAEPAPVRLENLAPFDAELDGRLVRVEGSLLDIGSHEQGVRLINQQGGTIFEALLEAPRSAVSPQWVSGSEIALTGVYQIQFDEYRRPHSLSIQLRKTEDVVLVQRPSWWTVRRVLVATTILAVGVVLGFGWVLALRRRVHQQTGVIREKLESEKAARLDAALARASKLESVGVLAGGIAHDFNNLLTVVMGNLSLARLDPNIDADTVHCLKESERAATRARDLTQQLLTFAKGGEPMRVSAKLPELVREAAEFALHGSKVRCDFEFAPDLWLANVDKGQIGQVVHNLVINANQAMSGGGRVQVVLANEVLTKPRGMLLPGNYVKLSFADSGAGISPENITRIFEPYFTTKQHGSGLGLATVYSIVKKHEGQVEVTSKVGQGTTFTIWLPAALVTEPPTGAGTQPAKPGGGARVLFMDDEAPIRNLGTAVLKKMGLEVTAVNDGSAVVAEYAAAAAAGRPYDLVIMDLTVPGGMGGGEAMEKLRAMDTDVRAIVSSGYSSDPVMANFQAHGFLARVPKPYLAGDLVAAVNLILGHQV